MKFDINIVIRVAHEANRALCRALGDFSQPAWVDAPQWQIKSIQQGVKLHYNALESGIRLSPSVSHENWMKQKLADGWVFGSAKDPDKKTHPALVPYEELPEEQKIKDYLFRAVVEAFHECEISAR